MNYVREQVMGTTPQDIKKMNDNMQNIWFKVFGDITFSDANKDLQKKIMTQWLPVQSEGNIDNTHPLYVRFFIPPNVTEIKSSSINLITSRYRMDSGITSGGGSVVATSNATSSSGGGFSVTSGSSAGGVASVSGGSSSAYVDSWGGSGQWSAPSYWLDDGAYMTPINGTMNSLYYAQGGSPQTTLYCRAKKVSSFGNSDDNINSSHAVDMRAFQHKHELPSHGHSISLSPHSHAVQGQPHSHTVDMKITIPDHTHDLNEGIKESKSEPSGVTMYINDNKVTNAINGDNQTQDNINITEHLNIGAWNVIKITSTTVSRVTLYGTVEIIIK